MHTTGHASSLTRFGHTPRLIPPEYVKPFVKTNKHDAADAAAIATAARQPDMPTVAVKSPEQQAVLSIHRAREGLVKSRTALCNQIRGLLAEFGMVLPVGVHQLQSRVPALLEAGENDLPDLLRQLIQRLYEHLKESPAEFGKFRTLSRLRKRSFPQRGPNPRKTRLAALRKPVAIVFPLATGFCNAAVRALQAHVRRRICALPYEIFRILR